MKRFISGVAAAVFSGVAALLAQIASAPLSVPQPNVTLVELFTSEGCSSCPPADAVLRRINGTQPFPGQLIVGISEHVTYWNSLGWRDSYSSATYTDRQNLYGNRFGLDSVYTPQMVVNGAEQFVGSDEASLLAALRKEQTVASAVTLRILSTREDGDFLNVAFSAVGNASSRGAAIMAVLADDLAQSHVKNGENAGRILSHVAVARSLEQVAVVKTGVEQEVRTSVPASLRTSSGHHLILFAQAKNNGRVLGADTKPL